jgi:NAD(P)-dependent dehydrogenase (short-subunit alcohol dehydrogenase family)
LGKIDGKNAIVTGSARGIGKAIAVRLAKDGANIVVVDVNLEAAEETAKEIAKMGVKTLARKVNVTDFSEVDALIKESRKNGVRWTCS